MADGLLLSGNRRYLWASESDYGTDAVEPILTDEEADIIYQQVRNLEITTEGETVHVPRVRGSASGNKHGFIKGRCSLSGEIPLQGFISESEQVPYAGPVLKAMNLAEDLSTSDESSYTPATKQQDSLTLYEFIREAETDNWRLMVVTGVRLTGSITMSTDSEPVIAIEGNGHYFRLTEPAEFFDPDTGEIALLKDGTTTVTARTTGSESIADQDPLMCIGIDVEVNSIARTVSEISLEFNTAVSEVSAITGDETATKFIVTRSNEDSRVGVGMNLTDYTDESLNDFLDEYEEAGEFAMSAELDDGTSRVTLSADKMQVGIPTGSDSDGMLAYDIPGFLNGDWSDLAGDNDFTLKFDASP